MEDELKYMRILNFYRQLNCGEVIYKEKEALKYGVAEKTIERDIKGINNYFYECEREGEKERKIVFDRKEKGYRLVEKDTESLQEQDIFILIKILLGSKGLAEEEMKSLIGKLLNLCWDDEKYAKVKALVSNELLNYKGPNHGKELLDIIWKIAEAVRYQHLLEYDYTGLKGRKPVHRTVKPVGILFSEYYFYLLAHIKWDITGKQETENPTVYRIDRISNMQTLKEHFHIAYGNRVEESHFRSHAPLMYGGDLKHIKFWYNGPSLEAILDRIPTAKVVKEEEGRVLVSAEVVGDGAEMWLCGQGDKVEFM